MHGRDISVKATVESLSGLRGHAGRSELLRWLSSLEPPRQTFLCHGELDSATAMAETLCGERGWNVTIPKLGDRVELGDE